MNQSIISSPLNACPTVICILFSKYPRTTFFDTSISDNQQLLCLRFEWTCLTDLIHLAGQIPILILTPPMNHLLNYTPRGPTFPQSDTKHKRGAVSWSRSGCLTCKKRRKRCDETKPRYTSRDIHVAAGSY